VAADSLGQDGRERVSEPVGINPQVTEMGLARYAAETIA
jgi:hypothetical protein